MAHHRIAMITPCQFPANYGSPAAVLEMAETLANRGHDVHVITYPEGEDIPVESAKVHRVGRARTVHTSHVGPTLARLWWDFLLIFETVRVIRRERCDVIHAHNYEGCLIGVAAKFLTGRPLVYNAQNLMSDELHTYHVMPVFIAKMIAGFLDWFVPIYPDYIITLTPELRDWAIKRGVAPDRVAFIAVGVRTTLLDGVDPAAVEKLRVRYKIGERPVVMYTGVNNAFQRIDYLLRAFAVVREKMPGALLLVVSPLDNEPDRSANEALARELGVDRDTIFVGPHAREDLKHYLSLADVCVVSRPDCPGQPIKLLNYMIMAKPTVCFVGGAKGVRHPHDAMIAPDHDWHAMGEEIIGLLEDPALRARIGANARETLLRDFDWDMLCAKMDVIYDQLTSSQETSVKAVGV